MICKWLCGLLGRQCLWKPKRKAKASFIVDLSSQFQEQQFSFIFIVSILSKQYDYHNGQQALSEGPSPLNMIMENDEGISWIILVLGLSYGGLIPSSL